MKCVLIAAIEIEKEEN